MIIKKNKENDDDDDDALKLNLEELANIKLSVDTVTAPGTFSSFEVSQ